MPETNKIICFQQDTKERKRWFKAASFAHPAKMHLSLQIYLIERYTKPGDTILDPMAGSGTILVACALGRNVVLVELEDKFVKMQQANWQKIQTLGPMMFCKMGEATILQGDARNLDGLLADNILFSPPYARGEAQISADKFANPEQFAKISSRRFREGKKKGHFASKEAILRSMKNRQKGCGENTNNISNLPYGEISAVISSPPHGNRLSDNACKDNDPQRMSYRQALAKADAVITSPPFGDSKHNYKHGLKVLGKNFKGRKAWETKGKADAILTSPPYEGSKEIHDIEFLKKTAGDASERVRTGKAKGHSFTKEARERALLKKQEGLIDNPENIGNLKSENYLQAMLQVYQQCHRVLKDKGLMVLVVKNFIRDKKIIRLDLDTIKICEKVGFKLKEILQRKLTQKSFWRIIYHNKYPDVPEIEYEEILVFQRFSKDA